MCCGQNLVNIGGGTKSVYSWGLFSKSPFSFPFGKKKKNWRKTTLLCCGASNFQYFLRNKQKHRRETHRKIMAKRSTPTTILPLLQVLLHHLSCCFTEKLPLGQTHGRRSLLPFYAAQHKRYTSLCARDITHQFATCKSIIQPLCTSLTKTRTRYNNESSKFRPKYHPTVC